MDNNTKNLVVAVFLMLGVWFLYISFVQPPVPQAPEVVQVEQSQAVANEPNVSIASQPANDQVVALENIVEQDVTIETDLYIAQFSNVGARLKSIKLKNYNLTAEPDSELVSVVDVGQVMTADRRGR